MSKHGIVFDLDPALLNRKHTNYARAEAAFSATNKSDGDKKIGEIMLADFIGQNWEGTGLTAKNFAESLAALGEVDELNVYILSPGGSIIEALGIYNSLVQHPARVVTQNIGAAWSAASWILQAGDQRLATENSTTMIHNGQGVAMGDRRVMAKEAEILAKLDGTIAAMYAKRTGRKPETFSRLMDEESWFTASEALDNKLIDGIIPAKKEAKNLNPQEFGLNYKPLVIVEQEQSVARVSAVDVRKRLVEIGAT